MRKRVVSLFFMLTMMCAAVLGRIAYLCNSEYAAASRGSGTRLIKVASTRGMIYDRNRNPLVNRESHKVIVVDPTQEVTEYLKTCLSDSDYQRIMPQLQKNKPFSAVCDSYTGSHEKIIEITSYERYTDSDNAVHLIGYTDAEGNGVCGIEKAFDSLLKEHSGNFSVRYTAASSGAALTGMGFEAVNNNYDSPGGVVLTIDSRMQRICEDVMQRDGIEKGAVVVLDVNTSEILALASAPTFDRSNLQSALNDPYSPFVNRAVNAYSVGSVFKPVVAAAALEKNMSSDLIFNCPGYVTVNGSRFNCHKQSGHGKNDMTAAMAVSCNAYFIELGKLAGAESIIMKASQLGFGKETALCDTIISAGGILPSADDIDSAASLANLSFGQGELLATPLQIAAVYCAFANGGYYREPYILKAMIGKNGNKTAYYKNEVNNKVLTGEVCAAVCDMLKETVESGSGKLAKPMGMNAAGKTATAETGWVSEGRDVVHTWFAGFYPADAPQYVIVVFKEDGSTSSTDCAPVFRDIADTF